MICVIGITFLDVLIFGVSRVNYVDMRVAFFPSTAFLRLAVSPEEGGSLLPKRNVLF
jgi:hypothetical protein